MNRLYWISLFIKGIDGVLELSGGVLLLVLSPTRITSIINELTHNEVAGDTHDIISHFLATTAKSLSINAEFLVSLYLIGHGILKLLIVYGLWKEERWVFPIAFVLLGAFIGLEIGRLLAVFSAVMTAALTFDLFVVTVVYIHVLKIESTR